jgi:hypothetical protein
MKMSKLIIGIVIVLAFVIMGFSVVRNHQASKGSYQPLTLKELGEKNPIQGRINQVDKKTFPKSFFEYRPNLTNAKAFSIAGYYDRINHKFLREGDLRKKSGIYTILVFLPNRKLYVSFPWKSPASAAIIEVADPRSGFLSYMLYKDKRRWVKITPPKDYFYDTEFEIFLTQKK